MTASRPRVGDQIETAAQLDALPVRSVVLSDQGRAWQSEKHIPGKTLWYTIDYAAPAEVIVEHDTPLTVLHVPGDQPRTPEPAPATVDDALAILDEMNEDSAIAYEDYSRLHDAVSTIVLPAPATVEDTARVRCAWCDSVAAGHARHNDGLAHPSCGGDGHGWNYHPRSGDESDSVSEVPEDIHRPGLPQGEGGDVRTPGDLLASARTVAEEATHAAYVEGAGTTLATRDLTNAISDATIQALAAAGLLARTPVTAEQARAEAGRRWPTYRTVGFSGAEDRQIAFIEGAVWATRVPIEGSQG